MHSFKYILCTGLLWFTSISQGQITTIPDPIFEQFLVDTGIDSDQSINGQVITDDINSITFLEINETPPIYAITDFTGIQDFTSLEILRFYVTNQTSIDFGNLTNLKRVVGESIIELSTVDLSGCLNLEEFIMNGSKLESIVLPQTTSLEIFSCTNGMLTDLNLSFYDQLTLINVRNNQLQSLNVANGNNNNVTSFRSNGNLDLSCIIVDDIIYSETNWTFVDPTTSFVTSQEECDALSIDQFNQFNLKIYPNPTNNVFYIETDIKISKIHILDLTGKIIRSFDSSISAYTVNELSKGIYFVSIENDLGRMSQKLIID